jgi:hypothetical protein
LLLVRAEHAGDVCRPIERRSDAIERSALRPDLGDCASFFSLPLAEAKITHRTVAPERGSKPRKAGRSHEFFAGLLFWQ